MDISEIFDKIDVSSIINRGFKIDHIDLEDIIKKKGPSGVKDPFANLPNADLELIINYLGLLNSAQVISEVESSLSGMASISHLSSSNGEAVTAANIAIDKLNEFVTLFASYAGILSQAIVSIKEQFEQMDERNAKIASQIGGSIGTSTSSSTGENPKSVKIIGKGESWVETKTDQQLKDYDSALLNDGSTSVWGRYNKYYSGIRSGTVNCTWYTGKKCEANGFNLNYFHPGNGKDWYSGIQSTDTYTATKYDGGNCLTDLINAEGEPVTNIVVSFPYSYKGGKYGHVLYIDQIVDGKVYYSDNGSPGKRICVTISEFLAKYRNAGNGSPIGCVHLESK